MKPVKRIGINVGGGYVAGINAVLAGTVLAGHELGWEVMGIRDGFDGLLFPERYSECGLLSLTPQMVENLSAGGSAILGNTTRTDPFRVRQVNAENMVEEVDRSGDLIARLAAEKIDAVISVVGPQALSILFRLHRQGLRTVCVPTSVENDVAATQLSFGFNSALSFAVDMLERVRQAAQAAQKIGVVEVLGEHAGWLALQAGIAVCADAVLIPEIPYDIERVCEKIMERDRSGRFFSIVVAAEGAKPKHQAGQSHRDPNAGYYRSPTSGIADQLARAIHEITDKECRSLVLGHLQRGGVPTGYDRLLATRFGAAAVRAVEKEKWGEMVALQQVGQLLNLSGLFRVEQQLVSSGCSRRKCAWQYDGFAGPTAFSGRLFPFSIMVETCCNSVHQSVRSSTIDSP